MRRYRWWSAGLRLAIVPVLVFVALAGALAVPHSADAAVIGDCATVTRLNGTGYGKIRWAGMSQCFTLNLKAGYTYTITTEVGSPSDAWSSNVLDPLGDSVMELWARKDGVWAQPSFDQSQFNLVAYNDDYNAPRSLASRIVFTVPGTFGEEREYVVRVSGYGAAVGTYSVSVSSAVVAAPNPCEMVFGC
jgi:hypothetical protein